MHKRRLLQEHVTTILVWNLEVSLSKDDRTITDCCLTLNRSVEIFPRCTFPLLQQWIQTIVMVFMPLPGNLRLPRWEYFLNLLFGSRCRFTGFKKMFRFQETKVKGALHKVFNLLFCFGENRNQTPEPATAPLQGQCSVKTNKHEQPAVLRKYINSHYMLTSGVSYVTHAFHSGPFTVNKLQLQRCLLRDPVGSVIEMNKYKHDDAFWNNLITGLFWPVFAFVRHDQRLTATVKYSWQKLT